MKLDHRRRVPGTGLLLLAAGMTLMAGCSLPTHNKASSSSSPTPAPVVTSPATAAPSPTATTGGSSGGAPAGLVPVEFSVPTTAAGTQQFAVGPDGNVWFTEGDGNKIGQITPTGTIHEFTVPTDSATPAGITTGLDHKLGFKGKDKVRKG